MGTKLKVLSDIEHMLYRPGMYIGSVINETVDKYILDEETGKFYKKSVSYNPGFHKLFDEIISNAVDESKRIGSKLDTIKVEIDLEKNSISILDNGGIPVIIHKDTGMYVPEVCFSVLKAGTNFDDTEDRTGVGTNGVGASCCCIWSKTFIVETADGINKFKQVFSDNMNSRTVAKISPCEKNYTKITYIPDIERFGMTIIDKDTYDCLVSRVYEVAGTNLKLKVYIDGKQIKIKSFKDYCMMFI